MSKRLILLVSLAISLMIPYQASALSLLDTTPKANTLLVKSDVSPFTPIKVKEEKNEPKKVETPKVETPKVVTYTVKDGDNLSSVAEQFNTTWQRLWDKNLQLQNQDILTVGEVITIPDTNERLDARDPVSAPSIQNVSTIVSAANVAQGGSQSVSGANTYVWGQCTWYVKNRKPNIGGFWGDAGYGWIMNAQRSGFSTGNVPVAGAIGVQPGHVVIIESVNGDGTVNLSEMNYNGGVGVLHYDTRPISAFIGFIYA